MGRRRKVNGDNMAKLMQNIPFVEPFVIDKSTSTNLDKKWKSYLEEFELFTTASGVTEQKQKVALLLHLGGKDLREVYKTLQANDDNYNTVKEKLTTYFNPKKNITYERFNFKSATQDLGESCSTYITRLKSLCETCDFGTTAENEIRDQFIFTCRSSNLKKKLLKEENLTLEKLLEISRTEELSQKQANEISVAKSSTKNSVEFINKTQSKGRNHSNPQSSSSTDRNPRQQNRQQNPTSSRHQNPSDRNHRRQTSSNHRQQSSSASRKQNLCYKCGEDFFPGHLNNCSAVGRKCYNCGQEGHLSKVCRNQNGGNRQNVRHIDEMSENSMSDSEEDDYLPDDIRYAFSTLFSVEDTCYQNVASQPYKSPKHVLKINNVNTHVIIDSGSTVNLIDKNTFNRIQKNTKPIQLTKTRKKIFPYGVSKPLNILGYFDATIENTERIVTDEVYVINKQSAGNLIGVSTSNKLNLLRINKPIKNEKSSHVNKLLSNDYAFENVPKKFENLCEKYKHLCHGKGKFKNFKCKLKIDKNIRPVQQRLRRQPYQLRDKIKAKLRSMEKEGLISKVDEPQEWLSNIVITPKPNGDVRICLDAREINKALIRTKFAIPTVDSLIDEIGDSDVFSKIDLKEAYTQIELDDESKKLTSFISEDGVYNFNRLIYGIHDAGDIFQLCLESKISDIPGIKCISDDIIVYSKGIENHKRILETLFKRLNENGFKVNGKKCIIAQSSISFFGIVLSKNGIKPDPKKVECLSNANPPQNVSELKSFLGLCTYMSRFIENYSHKTTPLRELLKKNSKFIWTERQQNSFNQLKAELTSDTVVSFFDPHKPITVWVDASNYAVGGILLQPDQNGYQRPVCYTSRALSNSEQKYSVTEKEALALVHCISKWHVYLYHAEFTAIVDHNPLKFIFSSRTRATPRIERWQMKLQSYRFTVQYKQGSKNIADYISRIRNNPETVEPLTSEYANFIVTNSIPHSMSLQEIREASKSDDEITKISNALKSNNWSDLSKYKTYKHEFCEINDIILRSNRIFIPKSLTEKIMQIVHRSCLGIVKLKNILRSKVYWYNMDKDIENLIANCSSCQKLSKTQKPTPVKMTELPKSPWEHIAGDFYGTLPTGEKIIVITDLFSKFPIVRITKSTTYQVISTILDDLFSLFGYPNKMTTDNGPPWDSHEFEAFFKSRGIKHNPSIPYWPRSNGQVERFMPNLSKLIRHSYDARTDWKDTLRSMLLNYRNCVHPATNEKPSSLFFNREINTGIPSANPVTSPQYDTVKLHHDTYAKKAKQTADQRCKKSKYQFRIGDQVFVKRAKRDNKFQTNYLKDTFTVINIIGIQITVKNNQTDLILKRHISFLKPAIKDSNQQIPNVEQPTNNRKTYPIRSRQNKN